MEMYCSKAAKIEEQEMNIIYQDLTSGIRIEMRDSTGNFVYDCMIEGVTQ